MQIADAAKLPAERVTEDIVERRLYSRDLAPVPALMTRPFFRTLPDAIVRPGSAEQVAALLREATRSRIPVTPRAAASTSYYNTVPLRGGIVLDVNDMRGGIDLDAESQTVRVLPATTWYELDDALQLKGFAVKSYPSSAVSATVGGWLSTQGQGIGSLKYGSLSSQLASIQVATPTGELRQLDRTTDPPMDWFAAAEGTLGVVTEVSLAVRPAPEAESVHLVAFDNVASLCHTMAALARSEPRPFTILFSDAGYLEMLKAAGFDAPEGTSPRSSLMLASFQGSEREVRQGGDSLGGLPGVELAQEAALEEWNLRLHHLRAKRGGPSLLAAELWLPLSGLCGYIEDTAELARRARTTIGNYGVAISPEWAMVMSIYGADERNTLEYLAAIGFTKRLQDLGARHGGSPYGVGLWNTAYLSHLFSKARLAELRHRKARLDPAGIMNPGKLYHASFPLWPLTFNLGAEVLATLYSALGRRRR